eukprot:CAMPEP_0170523526 /NCGR_PEP_ID=MMETSP0209-20121228/8918_1 /TAXON_ID=665100 ORGANISM="Litonotus pictus, Strain P1" /NCGR_SAMPLE_ID=MMETSP0209 /ASSEMBLY_ACC=CAM_ASM_000301 /LENGTH=337 /DNA_ID=CAMNT_0010811625 /DNA_START=231 /DNA_END=1245 /DNA_ORIENTATION=-
MNDYFKLKTHAENCTSFKNAYCNKSNAMMDLNKSSVVNTDPLNIVLSSLDSKLNETTFTPSITLTYKPVTLNSANIDSVKESKEGNSKVSYNCSCGEEFFGQNLKEKFIQHKTLCVQKKEYDFNQKEEDNKSLKERLIKDFMTKIEMLQKCFAESSKQKHNDFLGKINHEMSTFHSELDNKEEIIKQTESEITEYFQHSANIKDYVPENVLFANNEYKGLQEEEKALSQKKKDLENQLLNETQRFNEKKQLGEKQLKESAKDYKIKLQQYEIEENWLKETISHYNPGIISSVFSDTDTCSLCKNMNVNIKKYFARSVGKGSVLECVLRSVAQAPAQR